MYCINNEHLTKEELLEEFRTLVLSSIYPHTSDWASGLLINVFNDSKAEIQIIYNCIIDEFNSCLYDILQDYYEFGEVGPHELNDLLELESSYTELSDVEAEDVFPVETLKLLANRVYNDLLNGKNDYFVRFLIEDLNESNQILSNKEAFSFLNLLNFPSAEGYYYWFHEEEISFLTISQIKSFIQKD